MMLAAFRVSFIAILLSVVHCAPQQRAGEDKFLLYAYGTEIGGLPLYYDKDLAFAGDPSKATFNNSNAAIVDFATDDKKAWIGSPVNKTTNWDKVELFVPSVPTEDTRVAFRAPSNGGNQSTEATGFSFYGNTAMRVKADGTLDALFTGLVLNSDVIQLFWNDTSSGQVPISLRTVSPSSPPPRLSANPRGSSDRK